MHEEELNQPTYFDYFYTAWGYRDLYGSIPEVGQHVYVGLGNGIAHDESPYCFYEQGYFRTTVIARSGDGDEAEWVLRFHADYKTEKFEEIWNHETSETQLISHFEEIWNNVYFDEIVDSGLEFERTGREIVCKGRIWLENDLPMFGLHPFAQFPRPEINSERGWGIGPDEQLPDEQA